MNRKRHFSTISVGSEVPSPARRWQRCRHLLLRRANAAPAEEESYSSETVSAVEGEDSDTEEISTYDVLVQGEYWVVSEEIRDALVHGFIISMSNNSANSRMLFSAKKPKMRAVLKWIVGPAVARNRAKILRPLP